MTYRDIDLNFRPHPITGDLVMLDDSRAIIQSVKNLVLSKKYDYLFQPEKYSDVGATLFSTNRVLGVDVKNRIEDMLEMYEPRVKLLDIQIHKNKNSLNVYISFSIFNRDEIFDITLDIK